MPQVPPLELPDNIPDCHRVIRSLHAEVVRLDGIVQEQAIELAQLKAVCAEQASELVTVRRELKLLKRQLYGQHRERFLGGAKGSASTAAGSSKPESSQTPSAADTTMPGGTANSDTDSEPTAASAADKRRRTSKGRQPRKLDPSWPRERKLHRLLESDVPAAIWNDPRAKRFFRFVRYELELPKVTPKVIEHYQEVIALDNDQLRTQMYSAATPPPLFEGCYLSASFLAYLITNRFADHLPYYRGEDILTRWGINLHRSTIWRWMRGASWLLKPLVTLIRTRVPQSRVMGIDETPIPILDPDQPATRKAYLYAKYGDATFPYVAYHFAARKTAENVRAIVGGFRGYMQSDAYICYELLTAAADSLIRGVGCWAHGRRKFEPLAQEEHPGAIWILTEIAQLYDIEDRAREFTDEARHALRQQESRPIVERIADWLQQRDAEELPKSPLHEGVNYLWKRWEMFTRFLEDGAIPLDNNHTEASLKGPVVGKKNWLFFGNDAAGETAADLFTITMTCKRHHINVQAYLTDVLARIATMDPADLESLLPDRWIEQHPEARVAQRVEESHAAARRKRERRMERRKAAKAR